MVTATAATHPATHSLSAFRPTTDAERQASLRKILQHWQTHEDVWVFAYASLIWRPEFVSAEQRLALLRGYHRALCLWSCVNRGTPEHPGLVFGLDVGGSCRGVVFRIPASEVVASLTALWRREMNTGAYAPKWLNMGTPAGCVRALAFVMDRNSDGYVPTLPEERLLDIVRTARGCYGPCSEYVVETARALRASGIGDTRLETLVQRLQAAAHTLPDARMNAPTLSRGATPVPVPAITPAMSPPPPSTLTLSR